LSEDILRQECRANPAIDLTYSSDIFNKSLILLEDKCVSMNGRTLQQLGLETPIRSGSEMIHREILLETSYKFIEHTSHILCDYLLTFKCMSVK
jgi:hypothetical protein